MKDLIQYIADTKYWLAKMFLQLNEDKIEILLLGPDGRFDGKIL